MQGSARPAVVAAIFVALTLGACAHPSLDGYERQKPVDPSYLGPTVTFLGVSTLVLASDGAPNATSVATDGFFTRPGMGNVLFGQVGPNRAEIDRVLQDANIKKLAAIFTVHSHFDHAMDAPIVAERTGATLVGSRSTRLIAYGEASNAPFEDIKANPHTFGPFTVTAVPSIHGPTSDLINDGGVLTLPLVPPAYFTRYKDGGCYSLFFELPVANVKRTILVHASAGYIPGALKGRYADVVYLGIARLGNMSEDEREDYWREVVVAVGAKRVIPIHWDDFFLPLDKSEDLKTMPWIMHDFSDAMEFLLRKERETGVDVVLPIAWHKTNPFQGL